MGARLWAEFPLHMLIQMDKIRLGECKGSEQHQLCEIWRNFFFGCYHCLPFFLVSLLLHQHWSSDSSRCIHLSLLLGIEKCIDSLSSKTKGFFVCTSVQSSANQNCSYDLQKTERAGWDIMPGMPKGLQSQRGWDAEGNQRIVSCSSGTGFLVCLLRQVFCGVFFLFVCFFVYVRRSWRTGSKIFSDEHTSATEFTFSS